MEYSKLVEVYDGLESTSKRLEKTRIIAEFLKLVKADEMNSVMLLIEGRLFPSYDSREIGVAARLVLKSINIAAGIGIDKIENEWKKTGDLGLVAENLVKSKKQATLHSSRLTTEKVFSNLRKLAGLEGEGTVERKTQLIAELLTSATPREAKYIIRTVMGQMRIGVGEGSLRDAIVWAYFGKESGINYVSEKNDIGIENREIYNKYSEAVQRAYDVSNDFGHVAKTAKTKGIEGLNNMELEVGIPIKVMLALKADTIEEGFESVGSPAGIEFKYDGFRVQIHKNSSGIKLFTRRLEDVTKQFPEIVECVKKDISGKDFIIDSEAVGFSKKTGKYLPFQSISQRIKRKYDIQKLSDEFPVELNVFDIMYYNGKSMISAEFSKRRELIEKIVRQEQKKIVVAKSITASSKKDVEKFFREAINAGNEGLMFKSLNSPYKPGGRVGFMVKYKVAKEGMDLAITGAEWGEGKRSSWLSSYTVSCTDENGNFLEVGKVSTGLKEKEEEGLSFQEMTKLLKPLIIEGKGKEVRLKPKIVIEVEYEEIQKSPTYSSGYALRFPRVKGLREERSEDDCTTLKVVETFYYKQRK